MTSPEAPLLILLRHGETVGESSIRLHGASDVVLSAIGEQQAERAAAALAGLRLRRIVCSPLQRARRTAEIVRAAQTQAPQLEVVADLREVNFGAWEGWTYAEAEARDPDNFQRWRSQGPSFDYPGGEPRASFRARVLAAARDHLGVPSPGPTLAVLHKGVIKTVIAALTGREPAELSSLPVSLGSLHRLQWTGEAWQLTANNETSHLGELDLGC
jgi:broad specificity phosphatase PhoE